MFIRQVLAATSPLEDIYAPGKVMGGDKATLSTLVNPLIANVLVISGLVAFSVIIFAGFSYVTSNGDKNKVEQSQQMLNYGIVGLLVVATAFIITRIIGSVVGFTFF